MVTLIVISIASAAMLIGGITAYYLGPDNPIEEICEDIVEEATGLHLDLSPGSQEDECD